MAQVSRRRRRLESREGTCGEPSLLAGRDSAPWLSREDHDARSWSIIVRALRRRDCSLNLDSDDFLLAAAAAASPAAAAAAAAAAAEHNTTQTLNLNLERLGDPVKKLPESALELISVSQSSRLTLASRSSGSSSRDPRTDPPRVREAASGANNKLISHS